jgi:hypothetical protein
MVCRAEEKAERSYPEVLLEGASAGHLEGCSSGPGAVCVSHLSRASAQSGGWAWIAWCPVLQLLRRGLGASLSLD